MLVIRGRRRGQARPPQTGVIEPGQGCHGSLPTVGDADIGQYFFAAGRGRRFQQMRRFPLVEGDCQVRRDKHPFPHGIAVQAGGQIDGHHRTGEARHGFDQLGGLAIQRAAETRSEERIDHQLRPVEEVRLRRFDLAAPQARRPGRIAAQTGRVAQQCHTHRPTGLAQVFRGEKPVPAIIAGTAQNADLTGRPALANRIGNRRRGLCHKALRRHAVFSRELIAARAVLGVQCGIVHGRPIVWQDCLIVRHFPQPVFVSTVSVLSRIGPALASRRDHGVRDEKNRSHHKTLQTR